MGAGVVRANGSGCGVLGLLVGASLLALASGGCGSSTSGCRGDPDCPAGTYCLLSSGECIFDCSKDSDCPSGYRCTSRGRCEPGCVKTNGGVEACDGADNDCDGDTDEAFPELGLSCQNGGCPAGVWVCAVGGQGVSCNGAQPAADDASCDGADDDCDGVTDEDAVDRPCPLQHGVCAGATQNCQPGGGWSACAYGADYTENVDGSCDQRDNDCDGFTDEDAASVLQAESDDQATDGLDNNCNGLVDERGGVMVPVAGLPGVWVDAFEMTVVENPDCTGLRYGQGVDDYPADFPAASPPTGELYACSLPGLIPSGYLSWYRARRACALQGKHLCVRGEFMMACNHIDLQSYPYGLVFVAGQCNDPFGGAGQPVPAGSLTSCASPSGALDMSGNLAEWTGTASEDAPGGYLMGSWGYACRICPLGVCRDCVSGNLADEEQIQMLSGCAKEDNNLTSIPPDRVEPFFGARCCLDGP